MKNNEGGRGRQGTQTSYQCRWCVCFFAERTPDFLPVHYGKLHFACIDPFTMSPTKAKSYFKWHLRSFWAVLCVPVFRGSFTKTSEATKESRRERRRLRRDGVGLPLQQGCSELLITAPSVLLPMHLTSPLCSFPSLLFLEEAGILNSWPRVERCQLKTLKKRVSSGFWIAKA